MRALLSPQGMRRCCRADLALRARYSGDWSNLSARAHMTADLNQLRVMPRHLIGWHGSALLITDPSGLIGVGIEGFYVRQTRFLSRLCFTVNGAAPQPVAANPVTGSTAIAYYLAPSPAGATAGPAAEGDKGGGEIVRRGIEVQINRFVANRLRHQIHLTNHTLAAADIVLRWEIEADFADFSEAASGQRQQQAPVARSWRPLPLPHGGDGGELHLRYCHPQLDHACVVRFAGPGRLEDCEGAVCWQLRLLPQQPIMLAIDVMPIFCGDAIGMREAAPPPLGGDGSDPATLPIGLRLTAANAPLVQTAWDRAVADLASLPLLDGDGVERRMPAAGVPRYMALFGRDVLVTGFQAALLDPDMLRGTISLVARWNATTYDDPYDAQPGRVIHQRQQSPLALLRKTPFLHYYGDYSAPGWFLIDCAWHFAVSGDQAFYRAMRDKVLAVLDWMERDGDRDGDGFYEYATRAGDWGEKNQGWKDSEEAVLYPDGQLVPNPIALVEIQGCFYAAKQLTALALAATGEHGRAAELLDQAAALKRRFNAAFWLDDLHYFALALDPQKRPVRTIAGDPGQCLAYGIIDDDKAASVADRLLSPELFTGWGVRTLSSRHPAFNPFAYHLGSVWPVANALIGFGFKRYGLNAQLHRLAEALLGASRLFEYHRLPEVFGGHDRDAQHPHPGIYPEANAPQAWSAGAVVLLLVHAMLGLVPAAPREMLIIDPDLPDWLPEVTLTDLRIGDARVSLRFRRDAAGHTDHEVIAQQGRLRIVRAAIAGGGSGATGLDRAAALMREAFGST